MPATSTPTATTRPNEPLTLPNPRHAKRVPAHIGREQFERIRRAAYSLPQVVKPADYLAEQSPGFEAHLDKLGLVLLQKAAAGARPSRWIDPALMLKRSPRDPPCAPSEPAHRQFLAPLARRRPLGRHHRLQARPAVRSLRRESTASPAAS